MLLGAEALEAQIGLLLMKLSISFSEGWGDGAQRAFRVEGVNHKPDELPWLAMAQPPSPWRTCMEQTSFVSTHYISSLQVPAGRWAA